MAHFHKQNAHSEQLKKYVPESYIFRRTEHFAFWEKICFCCELWAFCFKNLHITIENWVIFRIYFSTLLKKIFRSRDIPSGKTVVYSNGVDSFVFGILSSELVIYSMLLFNNGVDSFVFGEFSPEGHYLHFHGQPCIYVLRSCYTGCI